MPSAGQARAWSSSIYTPRWRLASARQHSSKSWQRCAETGASAEPEVRKLVSANAQKTENLDDERICALRPVVAGSFEALPLAQFLPAL
jgi:hypothetical protein